MTADTLTAEHALLGTPRYMSPEQALADSALDRRSDIYSLGAVVFEMLTGSAPYSATSPMGVAMKHITEPPPSLRVARPDLSPALASVLKRAMAKEKEQRFATAGEFARAFEVSARGPAPPTAETVLDVAPVPADTASSDLRSDSRRLALLGGAGLVLCAALAAWAMFGLGDQPLLAVLSTATATATATLEASAPTTAPTETASPPTATATQAPTGPPPTIIGEDELEMVLVPAGEFIMGSTLEQMQAAVALCRRGGDNDPCAASEFDNEMPQRRVYLDAYYMDITEVTNAHMIDAVETITLYNGTATPWTEVVLHASPEYWPGQFELHRLHVTLDGVTHSVPPRWALTMLHTPLPQPLAPGEGLILEMAFTLSLPELDPVGWGPAGNAGWGEDLVQAGDWYPALVPYGPDSGWQTWQYHPVGDPVRNGLANYDVTIRAPDELTVAAAGFLGHEGDTRRYRLRDARSFAFLASPDYVRFDGEAAGTPLQVYVLARHESMGEDVVEAAVRSLALFQELFGPYPYDELVIAENGFLTAIEYSALISMSGFAFADYTGTPDNLLPAITAHEVAHQWWYGAVGNDQVEEPWLDESLAMMSEIFFYEQFYPDLIEWWWFYRVERWEPAGVVDAKITDYEHSREFVHDMYGRAAHFMWDLRSLMGRESFISFLRTYYGRHDGERATGEDFFRDALAFAEKEELRRLAEGYFADLPEVLSGE